MSSYSKSIKISVICQERKKYINRYSKTLKFYLLRKLMEAIHQPNEGIYQKNKDRDLRNKRDRQESHQKSPKITATQKSMEA